MCFSAIEFWKELFPSILRENELFQCYHISTLLKFESKTMYVIVIVHEWIQFEKSILTFDYHMLKEIPRYDSSDNL